MMFFPILCDEHLGCNLLLEFYVLLSAFECKYLTSFKMVDFVQKTDISIKGLWH